MPNIPAMSREVVYIGTTMRIVIEPVWARFFDFGAGRLPDFLADLVNGTE